MFDREVMQPKYVEETINDLTQRQKEDVLFDMLNTDTDNMTDEELISDISQYYPHLLNEIEAGNGSNSVECTVVETSVEPSNTGGGPASVL